MANTGPCHLRVAKTLLSPRPLIMLLFSSSQFVQRFDVSALLWPKTATSVPDHADKLCDVGLECLQFSTETVQCGGIWMEVGSLLQRTGHLSVLDLSCHSQ